MADQTDSAPAPGAPAFPTSSLEDIQHWTFVMGRAQQMMEHLVGEVMARLTGHGARRHFETA